MTLRIYTGDVMECLGALVPKETVDCLVVDPPYGETSLQWDRRVKGWPAAIRRVLKRSGSMWVFGSARMFFETASEFDGWQLAQDTVWEKHNGAGFFADRFRRVHEYAWQFYRDDVQWAEVYKLPQYTNDATARTVRRKGRPAHWTGERGDSIYVSEDGGPRLMRSVFYVRSEHGRAVHPTQKPLALIEPLLLYSCPRGGHVLDPFAGSGTVGILAKRHGMDATLFEVNPEYRGVIEHRIEHDGPLLAERR